MSNATASRKRNAKPQPEVAPALPSPRTLVVPLKSEPQLTIGIRLHADGDDWRGRAEVIEPSGKMFHVEANGFGAPLADQVEALLSKLDPEIIKRLGRDRGDMVMSEAWEWQETLTDEGPAAAAPPPPASAAPPTAAGDLEVREILVSSCQPHPSNIRPTPAEVATIKQSFIDDGGQLEPIDVRLVDDGFQILSGETRWLAAKDLKWRTIKARVRETCDDATAFHLLMVMNAKRRELSPIYKAQMIAQATRPLAEGGGGKTLEQAGEVYGIKSAGGASNLKRLLQLPQIWQERIASGEFPESFARLMLPYVGVSTIMAELNKQYCEWRAKLAKSKDPENVYSQWESRDDVARLVENVVEKLTRPLSKGQTHWYRSTDFKGTSNSWNYSNRYPCLFERTPEIDAKLGICELPINGETHVVATDVKLYDKLQIPAIKKHVDEKGKKSAAKAGAKADQTPKKKLTPAQEKKKREEQAEQLAVRIKGWRHKWLRHEVGAAIAAGRDNGFRLLMLAASGMLDVDPAEAFDMAHEEWAWSEIMAVRGDAAERQLIVDLAHGLLKAEGRDETRFPKISFSILEDYASDVGVDLKEAWRHLQQDKSPLFEAFFLLHNSEQLDALGRELNVHLDHAKTRAAKVQVLVTRDRPLPLPKSIALLKVAKAKTAPKKKAK